MNLFWKKYKEAFGKHGYAEPEFIGQKFEEWAASYNGPSSEIPS